MTTKSIQKHIDTVYNKHAKKKVNRQANRTRRNERSKSKRVC